MRNGAHVETLGSTSYLDLKYSHKIHLDQRCLNENCLSPLPGPCTYEQGSLQVIQLFGLKC